MPTHFSPQAIQFLRGLARNNRRDWFDARKAIYERELKAPVLALIEEINGDFVDFAPQHIRPRKWAPPQASMPIKSTLRFAVKCRNCVRENFLRTTISPRRLSPTR